MSLAQTRNKIVAIRSIQMILGLTACIGSYPQSHDGSNRRILFVSEDKWPPAVASRREQTHRTQMQDFQLSKLVPGVSRPRILALVISALFKRPRDLSPPILRNLLQFQAAMRNREFFGGNTHDKAFSRNLKGFSVGSEFGVLLPALILRRFCRLLRGGRSALRPFRLRCHSRQRVFALDHEL